MPTEQAPTERSAAHLRVVAPQPPDVRRPRRVLRRACSSSQRCPGAFAGILRLLFSYETAEELFPLVALALALPIFLLVERKTRRFGQYMFIGMAITALVVLGVASLVLYFMVDS